MFSGSVKILEALGCPKVEHMTLSGRVCDVEGDSCVGCYFDDESRIKKYVLMLFDRL